MLSVQESAANTAAIVRTYGFPGIGGFVRKLLALGIGYVVVVVPHDQDNGVTAPVIEALNELRVRLVEMSFGKGGRAWSAMLNVGLSYAAGYFNPDFVLMVSNTVMLEAEHLECLYASTELPGVMVAGATFRGVGKNGEDVPLGRSYNHHYRNTLALYRARAFRIPGVPGGFNEALDGAGGMEDLAWKLVLEGRTNYRVMEGLVEVPLAVHTHRTPEEQAEYETAMKKGILAAKRIAKRFLESS